MPLTIKKVSNLKGPAPALWTGEGIAVATTALVTVTFPDGLFTAPPRVWAQGIADADNRTINVTIVNGSLTKNGCQFIVRKSRAKMATVVSLLDLAGYEPDPLSPGTKIQVFAQAAT
jgi:hypothetical protein